MDFIPSSYQQKILDYFITNTNKNLLVNALAGSGKSSTACLLAEHSKTSDIYIAFNSSVVEEFKNKIKNPKTKVMTIHSLAYSIMLYNVEQEKPVSKKSGFGMRNPNSSSKVTLDNFKSHKILDELITKEYGKYIPFTKRVFLKDSYVNLYNLCRLTLTNMSINTDVKTLIKDHALFEYYGDENYSTPSIEEITSTLKTLDAKSQDLFETERIIDFTDMIWITYNKLSNKDWSVPYWAMYTNIYCDEIQDFSNIQLNFIKFIKRPNGRFIFIGDFHQCQPAGTKIKLIDGQEKNIEDIQFGDRVIEYSTARGGFLCTEKERVGGYNNTFCGVSTKGLTIPKYYTVLDKQEFFTDCIIKITLENGMSSKYTTNHNCYVKFNREKTQSATCLYLMERNDGLFRIGTVKMYASQATLGVKFRARAENFDRCWILDIFEDEVKAWIAEQTYSLEYQIPQLFFQFDKVKYTEKDLMEVYSHLPNMRSRAIALLDKFGRDINYPIWSKGNINNHTARDHCFITQSCNIIPNYMDAMIFNPENKRKNKASIVATYVNISKIEKIIGIQKVYGITTSSYHNYVADGILTHNSIYNFAGANAQAFKQVPKMFAPVEEFDLPICYRCAKSHLTRVNREYSIPILPRDNAPEGFIKTIDKKDIVNYVQAGDMIISRKNKWVAPVILDLAKNGIPVYIEDKEMVAAIKKIIDSSKEHTVRGLKRSLRDTINSFNKKLSELILKNNQVGEENDEESKFQAVNSTTTKIDNINFVLEILEGYEENHSPNDTIPLFSSFVTRLLNTTPSPDCVRLCSIHKAKGLEAENVFVLNEARINYDFRNSKEQNVQEKNLSYIATTRAKNGLYLVKESSKTTTTRNTDCYLLPDNDVLKKTEQDFKKAIVREITSCF